MESLVKCAGCGRKPRIKANATRRAWGGEVRSPVGTSKSVEEQRAVFEALRPSLNVRDVLTKMLAEDSLRSLPLLVLANKQDLPSAISPAELASILGLPEIEGRDWMLAGCSASSGEGVAEAFGWLNSIVAAPTDFSEWQAAQNLKRRIEAKKEQVGRELAVNRIKHKIAELLAQAPQAPRPPMRRQLLESGEEQVLLWEASPEQVAQFVRAPSCYAPEEEASRSDMKEALLKLAEGHFGAARLIARVEKLLGPELLVVAADAPVAPPMDQAPIAAADAASVVAPAAAVPDSSAPVAAASSRPSLSRSASISESSLPLDPLHSAEHSRSRAETVSPALSDGSSVNGESSAPPPAPALLPSAAAPLVEEHLVLKADFPSPSAAAPLSRFSSLSSTSLALPSRPPSPVLPLVWRKRAWYSLKSKMLPPKNMEKARRKDKEIDIHQSVRHFEMMGLV